MSRVRGDDELLELLGIMGGDGMGENTLAMDKMSKR